MLGFILSVMFLSSQWAILASPCDFSVCLIIKLMRLVERKRAVVYNDFLGEIGRLFLVWK